MAFLDETGLAHFWQQILGRLNNFVRAEEGKGLSTNDLTNTLKSNYDAAYTYSTSTHAPTDAEKNVIVGIQKNGTNLSVDSNRRVNITVPTKTSDLTNDSSFVTQTTLNTTIETTKSKTVSATLFASNWTGASAPYTYTLAVTGVTASSNGSLRIAQSTTDEQFTAWGAAQPRVTAQAAGTLTVKAAGTVPTIDIPVEVLIV